MTDGRSQPPIKQPATAVHRTRVVFLDTAWAVGRGCNVVCDLCIVSAVCSRCLVCARGKEHKIIGKDRGRFHIKSKRCLRFRPELAWVCHTAIAKIGR